MHLQLNQLIAYRDAALSTSEQHAVKEHLLECGECRARYAAFEHLALSLKDYFATHRPAKGKHCPDDAHWRRYLFAELSASDQAHWKAHLQQCDYCFDVAASLTKETIEETVAEPLRPPEWLLNQVEASEVLRQRPSLFATLILRKLRSLLVNRQERWKDFVLLLRAVWANLVAPPKWAYAVVSLMIILCAGLLVWQQLPHTDVGPRLAELPGKSVQLADNTYQLVGPLDLSHLEKLPESPSEWQRWYNALTGDGQPGFVVALLTPSFAEALKALGDSQQAEGLERLIAELEAQLIALPSSPIGGVLVEQTLAEQLLQGTYTLNQHLLLTFLTPDETAPTAQTVLKIETAR